jgi:hypothetical protein
VSGAHRPCGAPCFDRLGNAIHAQAFYTFLVAVLQILNKGVEPPPVCGNSHGIYADNAEAAHRIFIGQHRGTAPGLTIVANGFALQHSCDGLAIVGKEAVRVGLHGVGGGGEVRFHAQRIARPSPPARKTLHGTKLFFWAAERFLLTWHENHLGGGFF